MFSVIDWMSTNIGFCLARFATVHECTTVLQFSQMIKHFS